MKKFIAIAMGLLGGSTLSVQAQLAITEVMSSATTTQGSNAVAANSDWWELTNFGTNVVDLTGYKWNDNQGGLIGADPTPFMGLSIGPGESIIFYQSNAPASTTAAQFRDWWGTNLSATTQLVLYFGNGLSSTGDGIRLWSPTAANDADVVDSLDFGAATRGATFVYNPQTGVFDTVSTNGVNGAWLAAQADDVGSPGRTTGPVPLAITQHPTNLSVNPGDTAQFTVTVRGLPRPVYQWRFNGTPLPGERFSALFVTNVQADKLGRYSVEVNNGFDLLISSNASLALNAADEPPQFLLPPKNLNVFIGQRPVFIAMASGTPQPTYQWRFNGTNISGATEASYAISGAQLSDVGTYSVVASNRLGTVTNAATLVVTRRPRLVITEIMAAPTTNGPFRSHNDWWELTNLDDFEVDLHGYRFDDSSALLAAAVTITNQFTIKPGESIVFVESMTVDEFRRWWGQANLPRNGQIIPYVGVGLSLSSLGDAINLWNSGATEDFDTIASEVFSTATNAVSFRFDPTAGVVSELSVEGLHGAWSAPENGDIGSPGFIRERPEPRILRFVRSGGTFNVLATSMPNRMYSLRFAGEVNATNWTTLATRQATGSSLSFTDSAAGSDARRFYRVVLEP